MGEGRVGGGEGRGVKSGTSLLMRCLCKSQNIIFEFLRDLLILVQACTTKVLYPAELGSISRSDSTGAIFGINGTSNTFEIVLGKTD